MINNDSIDNSNSLNFTSKLVIKSADENVIDAAYKAVKPETTVVITTRGKAEIEIKNKNTLIMRFYAVDFISLRALLSSYLRWIETGISAIKSMDRKIEE